MKISSFKFTSLLFCIISLITLSNCSDDGDGPKNGYASIFNGEYSDNNDSFKLYLSINGEKTDNATVSFYAYSYSATLTIYNILETEKIQISNINIIPTEGETYQESFSTESTINGELYWFSGILTQTEENTKTFELVVGHK